MRHQNITHTFIYYILATVCSATSLFAQVAQPTAIVPTPAPAPAAQPPAAPAPAPAQPKFTVPPIILPPDPIVVKKKPKPKPVVNPALVAPLPPAAAPVVMPKLPAFRNPFDRKPAAPAPQPVVAAPLPAAPKPASPPAAVPVPAASKPVVAAPLPAPAAPKPAVTDTAKSTIAVIDTTYKGDPNNPFELPRAAIAAPTKTTKTVNGVTTTLTNDNIINGPREPYVSPFKKIFNKMENNPSHVILFIVLSFLVVFLAFIMTVFQQQVGKIWGAFASEQALASLYREQGARMSFHFWASYGLFVMSTGVFGYQAAHYFDPKINSSFMNLLLCMAVVALVALFRHTLLKIIAAIFPFYKEINQYAFTMSIFHQAMGLVLVPFVIFVAFASPTLQTIGLYSGLGIIALIYIYRAIRGLIIGSKYVFENRFHFLLYLCAVELAPMVIVLKLAGV
jgi:Domain of unknown function (DUF4271)